VRWFFKKNIKYTFLNRRKSTQNILLLNESKLAFMANELRTPKNGIIGILEHWIIYG
jgi:signal transduction histidine kinase